MSEGIFTIIGILIGYFLGNRDREKGIDKELKEKVKSLKEEISPLKSYGIPFILKTDEVELERRQKKEEEKKEKIELKDILKK